MEERISKEEPGGTGVLFWSLICCVMVISCVCLCNGRLMCMVIGVEDWSGCGVELVDRKSVATAVMVIVYC